MTKQKLLEKAYNAYCDIDTEKKLKNAKLTLVDHSVIWECIYEMRDMKSSAETISNAVATWFEKNGFSVVEHGVGWIISYPN